MLVGLSAVVLSLCGLFISIYEAGLMRTEQRASVWPHVETAPSIRADDIRLWVESTGIGPARVSAAALTHEGRTLSGWSELVEQLGVPDASAGGRETRIEVDCSMCTSSLRRRIGYGRLAG